MTWPHSTDELFLLFVGALIGVMTLFGGSALVVVLWGDDALALRMLNIFAAMFSGVLGLGAGYLLGRKNGHTTQGGT